MSEIASTGDFVWTGGDPPPDDHTLNACLARVIGVEIEFDGCIYGYWRIDQTKPNLTEQWDPLQNASQMEEVEAWLRENGYSYDYHWWSSFKDHHYNIYHVEKVHGVKGWQGKDHDKKRAFALAIWEMEQARH